MVFPASTLNQDSHSLSGLFKPLSVAPPKTFHLAGGITKDLSPSEEDKLRCKYTNDLVLLDCNALNGDGYAYDELNSLLLSLTLEQLQALYLALRDVFTPAIENSYRTRIVNALLGEAPDQWPKIMKLVCFIMPAYTRGHDIYWATEILCGIKSPSHRELLVNTASRFFKYDTLTIERGYILKVLTKLTIEQLSDYDKFDEEKRAEFIRNNVPDSLKEGAEIVYVYDPILQEGWKVNKS